MLATSAAYGAEVGASCAAQARLMAIAAAFIRLSRPKFLIGGVLGFAFGAAIAAFEGFPLSLPLYASGQLLVSAFHLMVHYANDYFDRASDARAVRTPFSGGSGTLVDGSLSPRVALNAALCCTAFGLAATVAFALAGNTAVALLGAAIGVLAWTYSAPPLRLLARGLGELDTAIVVGMLVPLTGYAVFASRIDGRAVAATLAPACAMFAMMIAVEGPDIAADAATGKRNLVVRWGRRRAARAARGAVGLAIAGGALWAFTARLPCALLGLALIVPGRALIQALFRPQAAPAEVAGRGVTLFFASMLFGLLAYLSVL
ncbi:MAG: hypothetical protein NVSMB64_09780 [Candidatus Velthaea sp.]